MYKLAGKSNQLDLQAIKTGTRIKSRGLGIARGLERAKVFGFFACVFGLVN